MTVWLGAPDPSWITCSQRPLFVSHARLRRLTRQGLPYAQPGIPWALDSGAYSFVTTYGRHLDTPEEYVKAVQLYDARIGGLAWASIQDWMCEPHALAATGLTVEAHQLLTVRSGLDLNAEWERRRSGPRGPSPFKYALQGDKPEDYVRCCWLYQEHGVDLATADIVGLGSVCGRSRTREIAEVVAAVRDAVPGIKLHGFGVKTGGLALYGAGLQSIDSQSWSKEARLRSIKSPRCTQFHTTCKNCLTYAEDWHDKVSAEHAAAHAAVHRPQPAAAQLELFGAATGGEAR
jgi:hypothetical protein